MEAVEKIENQRDCNYEEDKSQHWRLTVFQKYSTNVRVTFSQCRIASSSMSCNSFSSLHPVGRESRRTAAERNTSRILRGLFIKSESHPNGAESSFSFLSSRSLLMTSSTEAAILYSRSDWVRRLG